MPMGYVYHFGMPFIWYAKVGIYTAWVFVARFDCQGKFEGLKV